MHNLNVVVAGPSSGIGLATAQRLQRLDANIYGISRNQPQGIDFQHYWAVDITTDFTLEQIPEEVHGLVYCPGTVNLKPFRSLKNRDFTDDFAINVLGAIKVLRVFEKSLKRASGSVVLYSTVAVRRGMPFHSSVATSKGAIEGLTRALAAEWAPKVRINAIAPSLTDTPLVHHLLASEEKQRKSAERHPLQQYGKPDDIAALTTYLLSAESSWITGQIWGVDGGLSAI